ncbi:MAG TPA: glycosyltransferase, partial [Caulobacter sp.]|nr:glycosyltransferase [Caulobacter sp.]
MNSILPSVSTLSVGARPARPNVSVVMVVYRTGEALAESIQHVLAEPLVDEFVIVDNGSTPRDEDMLRSLALTEPRVVLRQGHGNIGFARGANLG